MTAARPGRRAPVAIERLTLTAVVVFLVAVLGAFVHDALAQAHAFSGFPADGPFQLYNALRRIESGQRVGRDFQFFHGPALPYLHFWAFRLLGGDLHASETTRLLWSPVLLVATSLVFGVSVTRRWVSGTVLGGAIVAGVCLVPQNVVVGAGNSLLGERSSAPVLFAAALLWRTRSRITTHGVRVLLLAAALLVGTEQGVALLVGYLVSEITFGQGPWPRRLVRMAATAAAAVVAVFAMVAFLARSLGGAVDALRFNFVEVSHDQFWYFGAPPNPFLSSFGDVVRDATLSRSAVLALVLLVALIPLRSRGVLSGNETVAAATLLVYGLVSLTSYLGIAVGSNGHPCIRALVIVTLLIGWRAAGRIPARAVTVARSAAALALFGVMLVAADRVDAGRAREVPSRAGELADHGRGLGESWAAYSEQAQSLIGVRRCRGPADTRLWSTYVGLLEDERGCFLPREDYIIHALGPARRAAYVDAFVDATPEHVQTIRTDFFVYENWLRSTTWAFYEHLYRNYVPLGTTGHSVLWRRSHPGEAGLVLGPPLDARREGGAIVLEVADGQADVVVVEADLHVDSPLSVLPVIGGLPRHILVVDTDAQLREIAVDPTSDRIVVAIFPTAPGAVRVHMTTRSLLPGSSATIAGVRYRTGQFPDDPRWREATGTAPR